MTMGRWLYGNKGIININTLLLSEFCPQHRQGVKSWPWAEQWSAQIYSRKKTISWLLKNFKTVYMIMNYGIVVFIVHESFQLVKTVFLLFSPFILPRISDYNLFKLAFLLLNDYNFFGRSCTSCDIRGLRPQASEANQDILGQTLLHWPLLSASSIEADIDQVVSFINLGLSSRLCVCGLCIGLVQKKETKIFPYLPFSQ